MDARLDGSHEPALGGVPFVTCSLAPLGPCWTIVTIETRRPPPRRRRWPMWEQVCSSARRHGPEEPLVDLREIGARARREAVLHAVRPLRSIHLRLVARER